MRTWLLARFFKSTLATAFGCAGMVLAPAATIVLAAAAVPAWGANADVGVTVTAVPDTVSLSRTDLLNYGAVQVTITPNQNNVINQLVFTSNAKVVTVASDSSESSVPAKFKASIPDGACQPVGDSVTCTQSQARLGNVLSYIIIYDSPTGGSRLQYDWTFTYSTPGSSTSNSSTLNSSSGSSAALLTEVTSPTQRKALKTFVPPAGGRFFTGIGSATSPISSTNLGDPSTTTLVIPTGLGLTNAASVAEDDGVGTTVGLTNDTLTTNATTISIPSTGLFLSPITIVLQRDQSTIRTKNQNAADRVPLFYTSDPGELWQVANQQLPNCADVTGPSPLWPVCVDKRIYVKNSMLGTAKPGGGVYTSTDLGDFLFVLLVLQNGRMSW